MNKPTALAVSYVCAYLPTNSPNEFSSVSAYKLVREAYCALVLDPLQESRVFILKKWIADYEESRMEERVGWNNVQNYRLYRQTKTEAHSKKQMQW